jgi:hypothetical protein
MANINDPSEMFKTALQLREGEMNRLFQRVNYFLVGTAFLIAALVTLIVSTHFKDVFALQLFAYLLTSVGLGLSVLFTFSNYINDRLIRIIWELIKNIEVGKGPESSVITWFHGEVENDIKSLIIKLIHDLCVVFTHPFSIVKNSKSVSVPYTWLIPFGFVFFWIGAIIIVSFVR